MNTEQLLLVFFEFFIFIFLLNKNMESSVREIEVNFVSSFTSVSTVNYERDSGSKIKQKQTEIIKNHFTIADLSQLILYK